MMIVQTWSLQPALQLLFQKFDVQFAYLLVHSKHDEYK